MNTKKIILFSLCAGLMSWAASLHADDLDRGDTIYQWTKGEPIAVGNEVPPVIAGAGPRGEEALEFTAPDQPAFVIPMEGQTFPTLTVAMYIEPAGPKEVQFLAASPGQTESGFALRRTWANLFADFGGDQKKPENRIETNQSDTRLDIGQWQHVGLVFDQGKATLYLNGQIVAEGETTQKEIILAAPQLYLGAAMGNHYHFTGRMARILISRRAFTESEIQQHLGAN